MRMHFPLRDGRTLTVSEHGYVELDGATSDEPEAWGADVIDWTFNGDVILDDRTIAWDSTEWIERVRSALGVEFMPTTPDP